MDYDHIALKSCVVKTFALFRVESVKLKFMMVNGRKEAGLIVSAGKDGLIKYWDIEE